MNTLKQEREAIVDAMCKRMSWDTSPEVTGWGGIPEAIRKELNTALLSHEEKVMARVREEERDKNAKGDFTEVEFVNAICFALIKRCRATNANTMTVTQSNVTSPEGKIGDWKITVEALTLPITDEKV